MNAENIFICPLCGRAFSNTRGLYRHLSQTHANYSFIINSPYLIKTLIRLEKNLGELRNLNKITNLLESIQSILLEIRDQLYNNVHRTINVPEKSDVSESKENYPSFLIGNPWIEVLSRRGRR